MYAKSNAQQNRRTLLPRPTVQLQDIALTMKTDNKTTTTTQKNDHSIGTQSKFNKQQSNSDKRFQHNIAKSSNSGKSSPISMKKVEKNEEKNTQNGISNINNSKDKTVNEKDTNVEEFAKEVNDNKGIITDPGRKEALEKDNDKKNSIQKQSEQESEDGKNSEEKKQEKNENHKETTDPAKKGKDSVDAENKKDSKQEKKLENEEAEKKQTELEEKKAEQDKPQEQRMTEKLEEKQEDPKEFENASIQNHDESPGETTKSMSAEIIDESLVHNDQEAERMTTTISSLKELDEMKSTISSNQSVTASTVITKKSTTTTIDVEEMEPPFPFTDAPKQTLQSAVGKESPMGKSVPPQPVETKPTATSTPGKFLSFKEIFSTASPKAPIQASQKVDHQLSDISIRYPQTFTHISGRRSIRANTDSYTPSHFQTNLYRESYRRINTELDASSVTNTSLNVTVGSEIPNNSSFSFFGRGRKREPENQSTMDAEIENSLKSPKRARMDMHGLLSVVASPLSMLRSRFSKTSIQNSAPSKPRSSKQPPAEAADDEDEVLNVSGASIEENVEHAASANDSIGNENLTMGNDDDGDDNDNDDDDDEEEEKDDNSKDESTAKAESSSSSGREAPGESMQVDDNLLDDKVLLNKCSAEEITDRDNEGTDSEALKTEQCGAPTKNKRCNVM